jgi:hypothetical protein
MKYVEWQFRSLVVPMILGDDGVLYTTSKAICAGLGIHPKSLMNMYKGSNKYSNIRVTRDDLKEMFLNHREGFGITRFKEDLRIWTENDMIKFAARATSEAADDFMEGVIELVKANAKVGHVTKEEHNKLLEGFNELKATVLEMQKVLTEAASHAGRELNQHKKIRNLKLVRGDE